MNPTRLRYTHFFIFFIFYLSTTAFEEILKIDTRTKPLSALVKKKTFKACQDNDLMEEAQGAYFFEL